MVTTGIGTGASAVLTATTKTMGTRICRAMT
jgi:hypothetical protein